MWRVLNPTSQTPSLEPSRKVTHRILGRRVVRLEKLSRSESPNRDRRRGERAVLVPNLLEDRAQSSVPGKEETRTIVAKDAP